MWLVATILVTSNIEHFHNFRRLYWTALFENIFQVEVTEGSFILSPFWNLWRLSLYKTNFYKWSTNVWKKGGSSVEYEVK